MRVTQTEKPFSAVDIKLLPRAVNDQNDPNIANTLQSGKGIPHGVESACSEKQNSKITKIRREYLRKIEELQEGHLLELDLLKKKHSEQKHVLTVKYDTQLAEKSEYIRMLEEMVNSGDSLMQTKKQKQVDESKYVYTEYTKNYVPYYEEISERIDFKIEPTMIEKQFSLGAKSLGKKKKSMIQSYSNQEYVRVSSSSKHKLIPKAKPSQQNQFQGLVSYKLPEYRCYKNAVSLKPFFL